MSKRKYECPCCEYCTLDEKAPGSFLIFPVCYWDDDVQYFDPAFEGGANEVSLDIEKTK